jgi:hypothetical protein
MELYLGVSSLQKILIYNKFIGATGPGCTLYLFFFKGKKKRMPLPSFTQATAYK